MSRKRRVDFDFDVTEKLNRKDRLSVSADVCRAVHGDSRALFSLLELEGLTNVTSEDIRRTQQPQFLTMTPAAIREKPTVRSRINPQNQQRIEGTNEALRAEAVSWLCDVSPNGLTANLLVDRIRSRNKICDEFATVFFYYSLIVSYLTVPITSLTALFLQD